MNILEMIVAQSSHNNLDDSFKNCVIWQIYGYNFLFLSLRSKLSIGGLIYIGCSWDAYLILIGDAPRNQYSARHRAGMERRACLVCSVRVGMRELNNLSRRLGRLSLVESLGQTLGRTVRSDLPHPTASKEYGPVTSPLKLSV